MTRAGVTVSLSIEEVAGRAGVDVTFVQRLVALGVIECAPEPEPEPELRFPAEVTLRVARVLRLERDLGVNFEGAAVILDLLDRIDQLEHELRSLRGR
jgi:hypothetical protein